jgi:hypothetical protein
MSSPVQGVDASPAAVARAQKHRVRWIISALVLLFILNAFLLPLISLSRYHRTVADSLSRALGHAVHLGSVNLTIFPLPGLVIHDLTVEEDPSFGAEPLLRAPSVTVFLRLSSLWRERIEISRINLDNASVNLARNESERWNFSSLLLQASRTPTAPTAQRRPSAAPRFPYIEFSDARINFKEGPEKKPLSFLNADASVWLADPNTWRIRFEAQPARTDLDLDLEEAGTIRLEGSLTRATSINQLPLDLHAEWTGAQLGQVSRLLLGSDSGWRGDLRADADITGDISSLALRSHLRVADVHRLEFTPINQLNIDARCQATWHRPEQLLDNLTCLWPTGDGHLLLTGAVQNLAHPEPNLNLEINHTPVSVAVTLLGLLRSRLPATLDASGTINGQFTWAPQTETANTTNSYNALTGQAVADTVSLHFPGSDNAVTFAALRFTTPVTDTPIPNRASHRRKIPIPPSTIPVNTILLEPATFVAGAPTPMQVSGQFSRSGFTLHFAGDAALARLQPVAAGLSQLHPLQAIAPKGTAQADLTFSSPWIPQINVDTGSNVPAQIQGSVHLQHAELKPAWLREPIDIASATVQLDNGSITWTNAAISVNGTAAKGSASYPATCDNPSGCPAQLTLDFPTLDAATLRTTLLGAGHGEFLQAILSTVEGPAPPWPALNGTIHAGTFTIGNLKLSNARAAIALTDGHLNITSLDATTLGGVTHATGSIQPGSDGPQYALNITCTGAKLTQVADLFQEKWGRGSIDGELNLNLHGYSDLALSATGDFHWTINGNWGGAWTEPSLVPPVSPGPALPDTSLSNPISEIPSRWTAAGTISNQTLVLTKGPAEGTITFDRKLDLNWIAAPAPILLGSSYVEASSVETPSEKPSLDPPQSLLEITGTLANPIVSPPPHTIAAKRPIPRSK